MTRDMAKAMCQHFMDARLIENAADPGSNLFKERGVYVLTPKGLHVLERFMSKNGINGDHHSHVFTTQPICMKLLHLERRSTDDEIIVSQNVIVALFRRFVGRSPNYPPENLDAFDPFQKYHERSKGVALTDVPDKSPVGRAAIAHRNCFAAVTALEWLCDFTSVIGREEAAEMAAQFVRYGLIALVSDKRKNNDSAIIFTVRGAAGGPNSPIMVSLTPYTLPLPVLINQKYSNSASSAVLPRRYTRLLTKVVELPVGICQNPPGIPPTAPQRTCRHRATPKTLQMLRAMRSLQMPNFTGEFP